jgi:hypothetical protein
LSGPGRDRIVIEGLVVCPGDTLVVRVDPERLVDEEDLLAFKADMDSAVPEGAKVIVVAADQLALLEGQRP